MITVKTQAEFDSLKDVHGNVTVNDHLTIECDITALDINARNINAWNINAQDINALDITARNINARNINAWNINAQDINYYAVCVAYKSFRCKSVSGIRQNAIAKCLDGEIEIAEHTHTTGGNFCSECGDALGVN